MSTPLLRPDHRLQALVAEYRRREAAAARLSAGGPERLEALRTRADLGRWAYRGRGLPRLMPALRQLLEEQGPVPPPSAVVWSPGLHGAKGRRNRRWWAPPGSLCLTVALYPRLERRWWGWYSLAAGVAVARVLREWGAPATIRWLNDILVGEAKVAGILTEGWRMGDAEYIALGMGINANVEEFPPELEAASLSQVTGSRWPLLPLAARICVVLGELTGRLERWEVARLQGEVEGREVENPVRAAWLRLNSTLGRRVAYGRDLEAGVEGWGRAVDLDAEGAIVVEDEEGGTVRFNWGELRHLRPQWPGDRPR